MKKERHILRNTFVALGAIVVTSLSIHAADSIPLLKQAYVGNVLNSVGQAECPQGMTFVSSPNKDFCIDAYEASPNYECFTTNPKNNDETLDNMAKASCEPQSVKGAMPWTHVTHDQAIELCARSKKHLASNSEWYLASLGTPDIEQTTTSCNVSKNWNQTGTGVSGSGLNCHSNWDAYDMIGNVWEWTFETVYKGQYGNRDLPQAGYVASVSEDGLPVATEDEPSGLYFKDRFWIDNENHTAIFRGGFWGSGTDGGRFSTHAAVPLSFSGDAVGFRCAVSI